MNCNINIRSFFFWFYKQPATRITAPVQVTINGQVMTDVSSVSAGSEHTMILKTDGTLWATGFNHAGQLGTGDTTDRSSPEPVM